MIALGPFALDPRIRFNSSGDPFVYWNALIGKSYQVEYKMDLNDESWTPLEPPVTATRVKQAYRDHSSRGNRTRYYRVRLVK